MITPSALPLSFVHRFLPSAAGSAAPVLLLLHGTGGTENDLLGLGHGLYPGASLLSPRGKVLENGMPRFFRRIAEGVFDEEDLIRRTHELADFVQVAATYYHFDANRVFALGYSNGANILTSTLLLRPGTLKGAVILRGMVPLIPDNPPDLSGVPVFIASGKLDPIVPAQNVERLVSMLREAGSDVTLHWSPGGHQLTSPEIDEAGRWISTKFP